MDTRTSMWILLIGNLIHIVLNYALIYGRGQACRNSASSVRASPPSSRAF